MTSILVLMSVQISVLVALGPAPPARGGDIEDRAKEAATQYLQGNMDLGRIEELSRDISFWDKLRLLTLRQKYRPFFNPIEDAIRNLARTSAGDPAGVSAARDQVKDTMTACWSALSADRSNDDPAGIWERGILVLVVLDRAWRKRNAEAGQGEVKNPFDLPKLFDAMNREIGISAANPPKKQ